MLNNNLVTSWMTQMTRFFVVLPSTLVSVGYVSSLITIVDANLFATIVTNEALWSMLVKQKNFGSQKIVMP
jgi:hypothetical protein